MLLREVVDGVADVLRLSDPSPDVRAVVLDDRDAEPGSLFACVRGASHDGHDHAAAAVARGAVAVLAERVVAGIDPRVPQVVIPDVRPAIGPIAARLAGNPSTAMRVVGVTGTNGKTTVTHMVEAIARAAGFTTGVIGTLGARWGGPDTGCDANARPPRDQSLGFTTPEAPALQRVLGAMRDDGTDIVAMEVSSHALSMYRVDGTRFAVVGFTNLSPEHLDLHGDLDQYFAAKARLFTKSFTERAVVCVDDDAGRRLAAIAARDIDVVTVAATHSDADVCARNASITASGSTFDVTTPASASVRVALPLLGAFNVANALVAIAAARAVWPSGMVGGIDDRSIVAGLASLTRVPGRLEPVANDRGVAVLVDYAHTPDALRTVLSAARGLTGAGGRVLAVYGCGGDRDRTKRPLMGRAVAEGADRAILTSDNPRSEAPEAIAAEVLAGLEPGDRRPDVELDRRAAIFLALHQAEPGDVVLIAGKGHETGQTSQGVTTEFDDRVVASEILDALGAAPCA